MNSSPTHHLTVADSYKQTAQNQLWTGADCGSAREVREEQIVSYEDKTRDLREKLDEWEKGEGGGLESLGVHGYLP